MVNLMGKHSDIVVGAAGSVIVGPPVVRFVDGLVEIGEVGNVVMPLVVGLLALFLAGKRHPAAAVAFASVQVGQAIAEAFPQLKQL